MFAFFVKRDEPATPSFIPTTKKNDIIGAIVALDKFLEEVSFYQYDRSLGAVRSLFLNGVDSFWRSYNTINNNDLYQNKTDYFINVSYALSEVMYYIKADMDSFESVNSELPRTIDHIKNYISQPYYGERVMLNVMMNKDKITNSLKECAAAYERGEYELSGKILSEVFKIIFIIN
jgi:hypothetical protein